MAGLLAAVVLARGFVGDVFHVRSGSMEPTLFGSEKGGETVLVRFARRPDLERFDLVVVERPGQREPVVKRVAGLPGESVSLSGGDLIVDGSRLDWTAPRPPLLPVFDGREGPLEEAFFFEREPDGPWRPEDAAWRVDGRGVERGSNAGLMLYGPDLRDRYREPDGTEHGGLHQVGDAALSLEFAAEPGEGRVRFNLVEEGDTFEAVVDWRSGGGVRLSFERWVQDGVPAVLAEREVSLAPGAWHAVSFRNVDNALVFEHGGRTLLAAPYAANRPYLGAVQGDDKSVGPRVAFGVEGVVARFRDVRIRRDLHFTEQGDYGVGASLSLGLDEYYLLGDNSADSRDGRFWGPVSSARILGRPVAVVWPWERRRWLGGARPPAPPAPGDTFFRPEFLPPEPGAGD